MKNLCLLPIACFLFTSFSSCKQKSDFSKEISSLDSLSHALSSAHNELYQSDTATIASGAAFTSDAIKEIAGSLPTDTINKEMAIFLSGLSDLKGSLSRMNENHHYFHQAIDSSLKRINDLKFDMENNLIDKNKAKEYLVKEKKASQKMIVSINSMTQTLRSSQLKLDSLKPRIKQITDSLKVK